MAGMIVESTLHCVLGYFALSLVFSVGSTIWFFPLDLMRISGYEAAILCLLSPVLLGIGPVRRLCTRFFAFFHLAAAVGIASFFAPTLFTRLLMTVAGAALALLGIGGGLYRDGLTRSMATHGCAVGLLAILVTRLCSSSLSPLFASPTACLISCALYASAAIFLAHRSLATPYSTPPAPADPSWASCAVSFGCTLFFLHSLCGDPTSLLRWCTQPHPHTQPAVPLAGLYVCVAFAAGLYLSACGAVKTLPWWLLGTAGLFVFHMWDSSCAFFVGLLPVCFYASQLHALLDQLPSCPAARTLTLALFVYVVLMFASVWTVAFNFVPYGHLLRERSLWLWVVVSFASLNGLRTLHPSFHAPKHSLHRLRGKMGVLLLIAVLATWHRTDPQDMPSFFGQGRNSDTVGSSSGDSHLRSSSNSNMWTSNRPAWALGMSVVRPREREPVARIVDGVPSFTSVVWTVHFGFDNTGWSNIVGAAAFLQNTDADVIGLLETDLARPYLGSADMVAYLAEHLGYYADYGPATKHHTWGCALLSRFPIVSSQHFLLPSPHGELAPALSAIVNISGTMVRFVVTHMGNDGDVIDRRLQAKELARICSSALGPLVFLGYMSSAPHTENYKTLTRGGLVTDIEASDQTRWCEYIFYRDLQKIAYCRISRSKLSDTEAQMAKFQLKDAANISKDFMAVINEQAVPESHRCPRAFGSYGAGHQGSLVHRYHMGTPIYYLPRTRPRTIG